MKEQFITGKNYDLGAGEIGRIVRTLLCSKLVPLGNLGGGARLRGLFVLLVSHRLGGLIFPLLVPFEDKLHHIYQRVRRR
ncbi:hypothetical protein [Candidatus Electronema sp. TJ]|uniref:hypothetical protein n=1 Tax=Candidatus Electronema sp. TJ TaxID=3401573 RepID=UPI003AA7C230